MKNTKMIFAIIGIVSSLLLMTCTSAPILPDGIVGDPNGGNNQNPDNDNPCPTGVVSFQYEVLPLMFSNCAFSGCHDAATAEDDIVLDSYNNVMKEVKAGNPNNSKLYKSMIDSDPDDIMPPPPYAPMTADQIALVRDWISQGAQNTICGTPCDPASSSFTNDIFPVIQNRCVGCHNTNFTEGNINLENHAEIIAYVNDGSLIGSIRHDQGFSIMPPSGGKMSDCNITQIEKWIAEGALNN